MNSDGANAKLLLNAKKYGFLQLIGAVGNTVAAWQTEKDSIVVADSATGNTKEFPRHGMPIEMSSDGKYVKFEKTVNGYVQPDKWAIDVTTGTEILAQKLPASVEWGETPACSPEQ